MTLLRVDGIRCPYKDSCTTLLWFRCLTANVVWPYIELMVQDGFAEHSCDHGEEGADRMPMKLSIRHQAGFIEEKLLYVHHCRRVLV